MAFLAWPQQRVYLGQSWGRDQNYKAEDAATDGRICRNIKGVRSVTSDSEPPAERHWKRDKAEDAARRRRRMRTNFQFRRYDDGPKVGPPAPASSSAEVLASPLLAGRISRVVLYRANCSLLGDG